jgi:hypothetical protein
MIGITIFLILLLITDINHYMNLLNNQRISMKINLKKIIFLPILIGNILFADYSTFPIESIEDRESMSLIRQKMNFSFLKLYELYDEYTTFSNTYFSTDGTIIIADTPGIANTQAGIELTPPIQDNLGTPYWWFTNDDNGKTSHKIWTEGTDGSGSGLNADLLDGLDSTAFHPAEDQGVSTSDDVTFFSMTAFNSVLIGASARLVALTNGVALEVYNQSTTNWVRQAEWTE